MTVRASAWIRIAIPAAMLLWQLAAPASGFAQAWLPPKGEGSVSILFQDVAVTNHLTGTGLAVDRGHIRWESMTVDATYGLTDKVTVSLALPYVAAKYVGDFPHPTGIDTGAYHSTFQDVRFDVRYNAFKGPLVITPFVGTIVPSHDYQYYAHSAVGRDLRELQVGAYVARRIDPILPGGFIQGRYSYGFAERVLDISHNHSNMDLEVGYFVNPSLRMFGMGAGQITHGGIDLPNPLVVPFLSVYSQEQLLHHDQISRDNFLNLGGGAAFSLNDSVDLFGSVTHTVTGRNIHSIRLGLAFGITYSFKRGGGAAVLKDTRQHSLVRCLCEKKAS